MLQTAGVGSRDPDESSHVARSAAYPVKKSVETVLTSEVSHIFKIPCSLMIVRQTGTHTERALTDLYDKIEQVIYIFFIFILYRHAEDIGNDQSFKISRYTQITIDYICIRLIKIVPCISFREHILQSRASHSAAPHAKGSALILYVSAFTPTGRPLSIFPESKCN